MDIIPASFSANLTDWSIVKGKIEGKIESEKAKALDVARTMLAKGFDIDTIAEISTLTTEEIKSL